MQAIKCPCSLFISCARRRQFIVDCFLRLKCYGCGAFLAETLLRRLCKGHGFDPSRICGCKSRTQSFTFLHSKGGICIFHFHLALRQWKCRPLLIESCAQMGRQCVFSKHSTLLSLDCRANLIARNPFKQFPVFFFLPVNAQF